MPASCAVIGCKSRGYQSGRKFFSFPMINKQSLKSMTVTQARQNAWFKALNRADFFTNQFKHSRVCDLHFISGRSAKYSDVTHPDWVPTLHLGYQRKEPGATVDIKLEETSDVESEIDAINDTFVEIICKKTQTSIASTSIGTQTDSTITGISPEIVTSYEAQIKSLKKIE